MRRTERLPFLILSLFIIGGGLGLLYVVVRLLDVPSVLIQQWTDLDSEISIATWYSSLQLFIPALLLTPVIVGAFKRRDGHPWALVVLALMFVVLSADESVQFHEWVGYKSDELLPGGDRSTTIFALTGIWMLLLGIPFIIVLSLLLRRLRSEFRRVPGVMTKFVTGAAIWLGGAVGLEALSNFINPANVALGITEVFFEETAEMLGVTVMVWAVYQLLMGLGFEWRLTNPDGPGEP